VRFTAKRPDDSVLTALAAEVCRQLVSAEFESIEVNFGYAVSLGRVPAEAIANDLSLALSDLQAERLSATSDIAVSIAHLEVNEQGILSVVECQCPTNLGSDILVELVLSAEGADFHLTLEQISSTGSPAQSKNT
jgi:hypothetical protein